MLTKSDLTQIRKIVREEVETEVTDAKKTLDSQIRLSKLEVKNSISDLDDRLKNVEISVGALEKDLKYLRKTANIIVKNYNEADVRFEKRVTKIEEHLQI